MPLDSNRRLVNHKRERPLILVTNDDGIHSKGLSALVSSLKRLGDVLVVAPAAEQSAISHALTLHKPLRCDKVRKNIYVVDGTPTDCINLGVHLILKGHSPDIIFSGINNSPNLGDDIHYSATVSAALEGGIMGIPSVAVSFARSLNKPVSGCGKFKVAADFSLRLGRVILKKGLPKGIILNVNVPDLKREQIKGYKATFLGKQHYANIMNEQIDPRGKKYYWIHGEEDGFEDIPGSDCNAISNKYVSITPIRVDPAEHGYIKKMKGWKI